MKTQPANNLCECGRPSARKASERTKYVGSNGCERCLAIEASAYAEKQAEAFALRPAGRRNKQRQEASANPMRHGAIVAINNACDKFLRERGLVALLLLTLLLSGCRAWATSYFPQPGNTENLKR